MQKLLIICGPTATGKTSFALDVAKRLNGELISADSRQVYTGMDIITGKDLPVSKTNLPLSLVKRGGRGVSSKYMKPETSNLKWKNRPLKYYIINGIRVWLYDVVNPDEPFNVAFWRESAGLVIDDILSRKKLPIVVGGTGLYIKSLTRNLPGINIPPNEKLRAGLSGKSAEFLFNYLNRLDPFAAAKINQSDRSNPRRLIRAIEVASYKIPPPLKIRGGLGGCYENWEGGVGRVSPNNVTMNQFNNLSIGLTADREILMKLINERVVVRLNSGAQKEATLMLKKYPFDLPSLSASGYRAFTGSNPEIVWRNLEHQYAKRQLTWFRNQPGINWFDISNQNWTKTANILIYDWYNSSSNGV